MRSAHSVLASIFEIDNSPRRVVPMEGMRGLAVLMVFFVHYFTLIEPWMPGHSASWAFASAIREIGHSGVDLFFVLSGFLIYGTLIAKPRPLVPYFGRRIERIYPTFLAMLAVYVALSIALPSESKFPDERGAAALYFLANLLLLPGLAPIEPIITVAWSLSYEFFYYLMVPLIIGALRLRSWAPRSRIVLWLLVATAIFAYAFQFGGHVRLAMFVSGILLYETLTKIRAPLGDSLAVFGLVAAFGLTVVISSLGWPGPLRFIVLFIAFYALCYGSFGANGWSARAFSWAPLRWLGNMSYSYYLCHGLALKAFFMALGFVLVPTGQQGYLLWLLLPFAVAATLVASTFLFILVEKPYSLTPRQPRGSLPLQKASPAP